MATGDIWYFTVYWQGQKMRSPILNSAMAELLALLCTDLPSCVTRSGNPMCRNIVIIQGKEMLLCQVRAGPCCNATGWRVKPNVLCRDFVIIERQVMLPIWGGLLPMTL